VKGLRSWRTAFSLRAQILLSILGVFVILSFSTVYILFSAKNLQQVSEGIFERERFFRLLREDLEAYQEPLLEYLSTRSSNALSRILIRAQSLREKLPAHTPITTGQAALKEREIYALIRSYLNLAEETIEEKRGRNIAAYARAYDELAGLLDYINLEIDAISIERFRGQMDVYGIFITKSGTLQFWNLLFIICISVFAILLLLRTVNKITDPLMRLSGMAAELSAGNFDIPDIQSETVREMDQVVMAFNRMKNEIRKFIEEIRWQENIKEEYMREKMRNMKMEGLVRHMEIYALQAQMNPHFLFNTINTGMQLAIVEGADRTSEYMEAMAKLFRHIIRNKEIIVPLRYEIEGLEFYFYILKVRFPKNLDLVLDYDRTLLDACRVPVSILQPLVENCVIHAFRDNPMPEGADAGARNLINVRAEKQDRRLVLTVRDNGRGINSEQVENLLHPLTLDESSVSRVMGLENVVQRLYFFYPGDPQVVDIQSAPGQGTAVIISIDTGREPCIAF
jgi:sensor histidine kinase YesM